MSLWGLVKVELSSLNIASNYAVTPTEFSILKRFRNIKERVLKIVDERI